MTMYISLCITGEFIATATAAKHEVVAIVNNQERKNDILCVLDALDDTQLSFGTPSPQPSPKPKKRQSANHPPPVSKKTRSSGPLTADWSRQLKAANPLHAS